MSNHHNHGQSSQWTSPGQAPPYWTGQGTSHNWQGQTGADSTSSYYDPNGPYGWQHHGMTSGSQPKPPYRRWWFWVIIVVVLAGLIAIVLTLLPDTDRDVYLGPGDSDATEELLDPVPLSPESTDTANGLQRNGDKFVLAEGGTPEEALEAAQQRIDSEYQHYGPGDLVYHLRSEGFQNEAIEDALNQVEVDWEAQAVGAAQRLADSEYSGVSATQLNDNLAYAGFNADEIQHALDNVEIDYNDQALLELEAMADYMEDESDDEIREFLAHLGFEESEIDYAFDNIE